MQEIHCCWIFNQLLREQKQWVLGCYEFILSFLWAVLATVTIHQLPPMIPGHGIRSLCCIQSKVWPLKLARRSTLSMWWARFTWFPLLMGLVAVFILYLHSFFHRISKLLPTAWFSISIILSCKFVSNLRGSQGCSQEWSLLRHASRYLPACPKHSLLLSLRSPQLVQTTQAEVHLFA